jgi:hypothetical protein
MAKKKPAKKSKAPAAKSGKLNLSPRAGRIILGTRKGTIVLERKGGNWRMAGFSHPGVGVSYAAKDPRSGALWACLEHGHWGPKLSRSDDGGKTWRDTPQIKYPEGTRYIDGWTISWIRASLPSSLCPSLNSLATAGGATTACFSMRRTPLTAVRMD